MSLLLIRHTPPAIAAGVCYGNADVDLAKACDQHFEEVAQRLKQVPMKPTSVFTSPSQRCTQLADFLFPRLPRVTDSRLQEMHFGEWELQPWSQVSRTELDAWADNLIHYSPPGGESYLALYQRCQSFAQEFLQPMPEGCCVVAHGGVIRGLLAFFLQNVPQNGRLEKNEAVSGVPFALLARLLSEPIGFGAICHIETDTHTSGVRYTLSEGNSIEQQV